jgi:hypothetical protein
MFYKIPQICALSGLRATQDELEYMDDNIPEAWIKIKVERKFINPKWDAIQTVKLALVQQTLAALPEEEREAHYVNVSLQVEAQYAQLEATTDEWISDIEEVYIAPPEQSRSLMKKYNGLRKMLGLEEEEEEEQEAPPTPSVLEAALKSEEKEEKEEPVVAIETKEEEDVKKDEESVEQVKEEEIVTSVQ